MTTTTDSVKEIRAKKEELEERILNELRQFEKETNVWIKEINFDRDRDHPSLPIRIVWVGAKI